MAPGGRYYREGIVFVFVFVFGFVSVFVFVMGLIC